MCEPLIKSDSFTFFRLQAERDGAVQAWDVGIVTTEVDWLHGFLRGGTPYRHCSYFLLLLAGSVPPIFLVF